MHRTLLVAIVVVSLATGAAHAAAPRNERVTARIAERAYARQSIAEVRAARAEEPAATPPARASAGAPVTHPPIELLPTP